METARLNLRRAKPEDLEAYLAIRNSPFVMEYNAMTPFSKEEAQAELEKYSKSDDVLFLEKKETRELLGAVFVNADDLRYKVDAAGLAYYLGEAFSGQGYMAEAIGAVLLELFAGRGAELVSARVFSENARSIRLVEKLGFTREGCLRRCVRSGEGTVYDDVIFSMLKEEYEEKYVLR